MLRIAPLFQALCVMSMHREWKSASRPQQISAPSELILGVYKNYVRILPLCSG